ncbi:MAG: aminoglycoside phosphotransferase, partial [Clostridia bacterium]|nr:aminoglycoside phosphotransferase [Clostridia bacterium]
MTMERIIAVRNRKTIYRDGDKCIKVFDEGYSKADILNEALNQARVEETGLHIPRILEVTSVDGKWAIVSEFIKGKTLAQLMQENPDDIEKYLTMFVELQLDM